MHKIRPSCAATPSIAFNKPENVILFALVVSPFTLWLNAASISSNSNIHLKKKIEL
jgi:hypothetical protein